MLAPHDWRGCPARRVSHGFGYEVLAPRRRFAGVPSRDICCNRHGTMDSVCRPGWASHYLGPSVASAVWGPALPRLRFQVRVCPAAGARTRTGCRVVANVVVLYTNSVFKLLNQCCLSFQLGRRQLMLFFSQLQPGPSESESPADFAKLPGGPTGQRPAAEPSRAGQVQPGTGRYAAGRTRP